MLWTRTVWKGTIVLLGLLTVSQTQVPEVRAQSEAAEAQLTIVVRDADGNPLPATRMTVVLPQPPAEPRGVADVLTDANGRVTLERLDPQATYVLQFEGGASIIMDGRDRGFKPIQFAADQNAGRELQSPTDPPGFPIALGGATDATVRFVIGGTFSEGSVAAVPMFDLADADDAPVRPINPLTGEEMTPEQARTFHAVIGEPWGVARGGEASLSALADAAAPSGFASPAPDAQASSTTPGPIASVEAVPLPSAAAGGAASSGPVSPSSGSSPLMLALVATIVLLAAVIGVLLLRQRRRSG